MANQRRFSRGVWIGCLITFVSLVFVHVDNVAGQNVPGRLLNISTRLPVKKGDNVLIGGFIVTGTQPKTVIIRAIGPSLAQSFNGLLENPTLDLYQGSTLLASNDNWIDNRAEIEATGLQPKHDLESAIVRTLPPGYYTAIVRGKNEGTGIAVVEAYDLNQAADSTLANISSRGLVESGDNVLIGGFIVGPLGGTGTSLVVRAIGPSLTPLGVPGALQDPMLKVYNANGSVLQENDDWQNGQPAEIDANGLRPSDSRESAVLVGLVPGNYTAIVRGKGSLTGVSLVEIYHVPSPTPVVLPNPVNRAPAPPESSVGDFYTATSFLFKSLTPLQFGINPSIISPTAAAVIRGSVRQENGQPLGGVRISIQGRPEFGYTLTRSDGQYDIAVNGGSVESVAYQATAYLPAQRDVQVPPQNFVIAGDVVMIPIDSKATVVSLGSSAPPQTADSSTKSDAAGARSATMYFPAGTGAQLSYADGTIHAVNSLTVRATEYTVGPTGPVKMPAALPGTSAYTYCVALTADEAINSNAKSIVFDKELSIYLENYLGFRVGTLVPSGYYDREKKAWIPAENGITAKVMSITNGLAALDLDGDDVAESDAVMTANGIDANERQRIAARFAAGATFWRMPVAHFTDYDFNAGPIQEDKKKEPKGNEDKPSVNPPDKEDGYGELGLGSQVFREEFPVAGTNLSLHYASDRVPGYRVNATLELPLFDSTLPPNLLGAEIQVQIAGRTSIQTFAPQANLIASFQWDGRDVYHPQTGNSTVPVGGSASALVSFFYRYPLSYAATIVAKFSASASPANYVEAPATASAEPVAQIRSLAPIFALPGRDYATIVHTGTEEAIAASFRRILTVPDHRKAGFGGWSLTPHHYYDPIAKILYRGDGTQVKTDAKGNATDYVIRTNEIAFEKMAVGPTGDVYVAAPYGSYRLYKITPAGQVIPVSAAPGGAKPNINPNSPAQEMDNMLASDVWLGDSTVEMRAGPDRSIYLAFSGGSIWRLDQNERFHVVLCGSSSSQFNVSPPDGTSARKAYYAYTFGTGTTHIAIAKDGSVYYTEGRPNPNGNFFDLIRKIAPDGRIYTIAGLGGRPNYEDVQYAGNVDIGKPAFTARLEAPSSLAVAPDDSLYYSSGRAGVIRIKPNGILEFVVRGGLTNPAGFADADDRYTDEGKVAATTGDPARYSVYSLHFSPAGVLHFRSIANAGQSIVNTFWKVDPDGILRRVAGRWFAAPSQTGSALLADMGHPVWDMGFAPDGTLYFTSDDRPGIWFSTLRRIGSGLPGFTGSELLVASEDGQELYVFDAKGRHLRTIDPLLNVTTWTFNYDSRGFVSSLQDRNGLITQIERNGNGSPVAVIGPYGTRTDLGLDANGYLANMTQPDQNRIQMTNSASGLLTSVTGQRQETYSFTYDDMGRLTRGDHPTGGFTTLARAGSADDATITATTAGGRIEQRRILRTSVGGTEITRTYPNELPTVETRKPDGGIINNDLPVLKDEVAKSPDPRPNLAGQASYTSLRRITTPNGLKFEVNSNAQATFTSPTDPFSLSSFVKTSLVNGQEWKNSYEAATRSFTLESPEKRKLVLRVDAAGRLNNSKQGNLAAETFAYDNFGRLTTLTAGGGADARTVAVGYDARGYVNFLHAPDGRESQITNNVFGQPTTLILPGNRTVGFTYGVDSRLESVTPPSRPAYTFQYDVATGRITYKAPALAGVDNTTIFEQTLDRHFKSLTLPGGRHLDAARAPSGKISSITNTFGDTFTYNYNAVGQISGINHQGGQTVALSYIGLGVSNVTWSGGIAGSLTRQFNNELRISSETVNGVTPILFGYNGDRLMISAGGLAITWRSDIDLPASTTIGNVTTAYDYDAFGSPTHTTATANGVPLLDIKETRDLGGRVVTRTEDLP